MVSVNSIENKEVLNCKIVQNGKVASIKMENFYFSGLLNLVLD